jgi:hypothetical protein
MAEGHSREKLLTSWQPGRREGGRKREGGDGKEGVGLGGRDRESPGTIYTLQRHASRDILPPTSPPYPIQL